MHLNSFDVNSNLQSEVNYGSIEFPLKSFFDDLCKYDIGFIPWHWHKEVQFAVVKKGTVEFSFLNKSIKASEGDGVFINSNSLHQIKPIIEDSVVINIVFNHTLIADYSLSLIGRKYIYPIINTDSLNFLFLDKSIEWNKDIILKLYEIYDLYEQNTFGYELLIKSILCDLWFILAQNLIPNLNLTFNFNEDEDKRIKLMLEYIHNNFSTDISLKDISDSVHISKSECCRCFKKYLNTSPFEYVVQYRIREASKLLQNTIKNITEVMNLVGFNDASYFTRTFKKLTNYTPTQYRKNIFKPQNK